MTTYEKKSIILLKQIASDLKLLRKHAEKRERERQEKVASEDLNSLR